MRCNIKASRAFGIVEMIVVIAIISIVAAISLQSFISANKAQALEKDAETVKAVFERARSLTLSSYDRQQYGVHIQTDRVVLFNGVAYDPSASTNITEKLSSMTAISSFSIQGGGSNVIFKKLTGKTDNYGTLSISLISDPAKVNVITINATGIVQ